MTDPLTPAQLAELRDPKYLTVRQHGKYADQVWVVLDGGKWVAEFSIQRDAEDYVALLTTVEAQAEVIERLRKGYRAVYEFWVRDGTPEPISPTHQLVLWGEVVREESDG